MIKISRSYLLVISIALFTVACKQAIKPGELYGKWNYVKVERPKLDPPDSTSASELNAAKPFVEFLKGDSLIIVWNAQRLSHGTFKMDGRNIQYKEILPDGSTRTFPFWITKFENNTMVFETQGEDGSRVTAVKQLN